ncbi:helix-turn-helix domain-containing protein [Heliobacterium gestii]|uniref:Helix-turn-helix domain-containing protein n=1 Tax=Heliomicrobium gestii TaxID=2699 RepID=A0A845LD85_HELGE|nr:helix-turn-helix domain-containing protein [Heliomicrobium gestii]
MKFREKLILIRKSRNLTQQQVADRMADMTGSRYIYSTISNWERDKCSPSPEYIRLLAISLGCSADELLGVEEFKKSINIKLPSAI